MKTYNLQKEFFTKFSSEIEYKDKRIDIYKDLVFHRFDEALSSSFEVFKSYIGDERFYSYIREFIKHKPTTVYVWRCAFEFRVYLINNHRLTKREKQILAYESSEIRVFMAKDSIKRFKFDYNHRYKLSNYANLLKIDTPIDRGELYKDDTRYVLIYQESDGSVYVDEITKFMYSFLLYLNKMTPNSALRALCYRFNLNIKDTKIMIDSAIGLFVDKKIIKKR
jgi:hypothetical protein